MSTRVSLLSYVNSFYGNDAMPGARHLAQTAFNMKLIGSWRGTNLQKEKITSSFMTWPILVMFCCKQTRKTQGETIDE